MTGAAGFIGFHLCRALLERGKTVVGVDSLNDYYDVSLKQARLQQLEPSPRFRFLRLDLTDPRQTEALFAEQKPGRVAHLAAQVGVRYSLQNPYAYADSNLTGFLNVLEGCRQQRVEHLVFASSSSVYGANTQTPYSEHDPADHPISLYAATKKANEMMAHAYSHAFGLSVTGLRFFTVYGPWGRPDMATFAFTKAILEGQPIEVYNEGRMQRDFTYVDDIVEGVARVLERPPAPTRNWASNPPDPATSSAPYRLYNIGNNQPVELGYFIETLENCLGKKAVKRLRPMQPGEVPVTCASVEDLARDFGFRPATSIEAGLARFVEWYRAYYHV